MSILLMTCRPIGSLTSIKDILRGIGDQQAQREMALTSFLVHRPKLRWAFHEHLDFAVVALNIRIA